jgi:adenylate cyclase
VISERQHNVKYRFVSDYPFANRAPHALDQFETDSLRSLRRDPNQVLSLESSSLFVDQVRLVAPVIMGAACVNCHNAHPESTKHDWKVGDVRGLQEVTIAQPIGGDIFAFKYLLAYFFLVALIGFLFIALQRRQAAVIQGMNTELETANDFLASLSMKISRYLAPQIYKSIFSGQKDVTIQTERKRLTIFFSDIKDFTATTEQLQPEQITELLNEYFTEMSKIALVHGGTIDKFIGDAMLIFFGDPETKGDGEDAKACLHMAIEMQDRIAGLNAKWRNAGIEHLPRPHGRQYGILQRREFRQRRSDGLHDHRRGGQSGRAPAIGGGARPHCRQLRNLRAGPRHRRRAGAAPDHNERN